jgi:hypothetical protein
MPKKIYQCSECKNYFKEDEILELFQTDETSKKPKKIFVCKSCYDRKINLKH